MAVRGILFAAVGTAGQRCTTARRLVRPAALLLSRHSLSDRHARRGAWAARSCTKRSATACSMRSRTPTSRCRSATRLHVRVTRPAFPSLARAQALTCVLFLCPFHAAAADTLCGPLHTKRAVEDYRRAIQAVPEQVSVPCRPCLACEADMIAKGPGGSTGREHSVRRARPVRPPRQLCRADHHRDAPRCAAGAPGDLCAHPTRDHLQGTAPPPHPTPPHPPPHPTPPPTPNPHPPHPPPQVTVAGGRRTLIQARSRMSAVRVSQSFEEAVSYNNEVHQGLSSAIFTGSPENVFRWLG